MNRRCTWESWASAVVVAVCASLASAAPPAGYEFTFSDEFNGSALDTTTWRLLDSRPNVSVGSGVADFLTVETSPGVYQEGWIDATNFKQRYGYFEARMRIGDKSGLNNAFWLNSATEWSGASNDHDRLEIDIVEAHYPDSVSKDYTSTIHDWETGSSVNRGGHSRDVGNLSTGFNLYGLDWRTDNTLVFSLNGNTTYTVTAAAFEAAQNTLPLEIIFSTKVLTGGFAGTVDPNVGGTKMSVDYVRVYDETGFIGATSGNWGTGTNWGDGDWDRTSEAALFNRATPSTTITVAGADKQAREILFDNSSVPALTFVPRSDFPNAILRLGGNATAGITINEDVVTTQTFEIPVVAEGNITLSNLATAAGVKLVFNSPISGVGTNRELTFFTANDIEANGAIESTIADVQKYHLGATLLAGNNTYTGQTRIRQGTLTVASPTALGSAANGTIVSSGATLGLAAGITYTVAEPLQIAGAGNATTGRAGAIELIDASNVSIESMSITLSENATVSNPSASGRLRLGSVTINSGQTLSFVGAGTTEVTGVLSGSGRFVSTGNGTLLLSGNNTLASTTTITGSTLALSATGSINSTSGVILANGTFDVSAKGVGGYVTANLSGNGTVVGTLSVSNRLAIGTSPGTINFESLTLGGNSTYLYEVTGGGVTADLGNISTALGLGNAALDMVQLGTYTLGNKFTLFAYNSGSLTGTFLGLSDGATFTDAGGSWQINYDDASAGFNGGAGNMFVTVTAVPEPASIAILAAGINAFLLLRRRFMGS